MCCHEGSAGEMGVVILMLVVVFFFIVDSVFDSRKCNFAQNCEL